MPKRAAVILTRRTATAHPISRPLRQSRRHHVLAGGRSSHRVRELRDGGATPQPVRAVVILPPPQGAAKDRLSERVDLSGRQSPSLNKDVDTLLVQLACTPAPLSAEAEPSSLRFQQLPENSVCHTPGPLPTSLPSVTVAGHRAAASFGSQPALMQSRLARTPQAGITTRREHRRWSRRSHCLRPLRSPLGHQAAEIACHHKSDESCDSVTRY
jgi:hypothetical protein